MKPSPLRSMKRASSESLLTKATSSSVPRARLDPFSQLSMKTEKTPVLKPTCHKTATEKIIDVKVMKPPKPKVLTPLTSLFTVSQLTSKPFRKSPSLKPTVSCGIFKPLSKQSVSIANPTFSAKAAEKSERTNVKMIYRTGQSVAVPVRQVVKDGSFSKKMIKRVNNVVFKENPKRYKSALDFSFANPEFFSCNL